MWRVRVHASREQARSFLQLLGGASRTLGWERRTDVDLSHPWKSSHPRPRPTARPEATVSSEVGCTEPRVGDPLYVARCYVPRT